MRLNLVASLFTLSSLIAARSPSTREPIQIYLHPTPISQDHSVHVPTLSAGQAKVVLSHHLGEVIGDLEELPDNEGQWKHLVYMWSENKQRGLPKVVVIEGGVMPQDILPSTLPSTPAFYLSEHSSESLLAPYLDRASYLSSHILDTLPEFTKTFKDVFDMSGTKAAEMLSHELSCLTAMADSLPWIDHSLTRSHPWESISIAGLKGLNRGNEIWETGRQGIKAGLTSMTTPDSPPLLLILVPSGFNKYSARSRPAHLSTRATSNASLADACYSSNATCTDSTSCNGRGYCVLKSKTQPGAADGECWGCRCAAGFAGVECQKIDYSVPFVILIFSTILLIGLLIGSVVLLYTVGDEKLPSTLTLAIGGHIKRD